VALYRLLHQTCIFPLVDKVVQFLFLLPYIIHLLHNFRLEHNLRSEDQPHLLDKIYLLNWPSIGIRFYKNFLKMLGGNKLSLLWANLIQVYLILFGVRVPILKLRPLLKLRSLLKLKDTTLGIIILSNRHRISQGLPNMGRLHMILLVCQQGFHPKVTSTRR
jgi:hypothetical protein